MDHQRSPVKSPNKSPKHSDQKLEGKAAQTCWIKFRPLRLLTRKSKKQKESFSSSSNSNSERGGSRMQSLNSSPAHPSLYRSGNMGREEMDESIRSAILYCKKTMTDPAKEV